MHNIKLTLAYDGTDFHGWQVQPNATTIQGTVTGILRRIAQENLILHAAGRTDAGVHALGQVAHFKTHSGLTPEEFQRALNSMLPPSIRITAVEEVAPDFHARWHALAKTYRYRIFRGRIVPPFLWRYVHHFPHPLDEPAMATAAPLFEGEHDFASFAAPSGDEDDDASISRRGATCCAPANATGAEKSARSTVRSILRSEFIRDPQGEEFVYEVRGRSFLRYMVRKIVGTLMEVGRGRMSSEDVRRLFDLLDHSCSGPTVPARGLCLISVEYPDPWKIS